MSLHAVDAIEDAVQRTKDILQPFDLATWTRLAIISLFVGGMGGGFLNFPTSFPSDPGHSDEFGTGIQDYNSYEGVEGLNSFSPEALTGMATSVPSNMAIGGLIAGIVGLVLIFMYLGSVFEFVMYRSIREKNPRIRKNFADHYIDGFKYMLFQIGLMILVAGGVIGWIAALFAMPIVGGLLTLLVLPLLLILAIFGGVVHDFGLQKMIETDLGFIASVKESVQEVTADWGEFGGYILFRLIVSWAVGIMEFVLMLVLAGVIGVPFLLVGLAAGSASTIAGLIVGGIGLLIGVILWLYVSVPFRTYMYSYFVELYEQFIS